MDGDSQRYAGNWIPRRGQDLPPALKFVEFIKYKNYNSNANHSEKCFQTCVHALNILFTTVGSELYGIGRHTKRLTILHPYFLLSFSQKNVMPNQNKGIWVSKSSSALHKSTLHQRKGEKKWNNTISKNRRDSEANLISVQVGHKAPVKIYYVIRSSNKVHRYTTWQHESRFLGYNWLSACLMANSNTPPDTTRSSGETPTTSRYSIISQMNYVSVTLYGAGRGQLQNLSFCKIHH